MGLLKKLFCKHNNIKHHRNIYGDEIIRLNARSVWKCTDCGKIEYRKLHCEHDLVPIRNIYTGYKYNGVTNNGNPFGLFACTKCNETILGEEIKYKKTFTCYR